MNETSAPEEISLAEYLHLTRRPKYGNRKATEDGYDFDSMAELARYRELKALQAGGAITGLEVHPRWSIVVEGLHICTYTADFAYHTGGGLVVEDVKSPATKTAGYKLKRRLMLALFGVNIVEIEQ